MAEEIPELYRSLKKTEKTKPAFKKEYNQIRQRLIAEGKFKSTDGKPLNSAILNEMGEYPYWKKGNPKPVPFGEGEFHQMSGGDARPFSMRKASQAKATKIRQARLKKANELMTALGLGDEVQLGRSKFDKTTKTPKGMAWDHKWEVQDFGRKYEKLIEEFASGSINEKQFKTFLSDHVSKSPGDIQRNLELKPQSENLAKEAKTRAALKQEAIADAYAVKDAKYTKFQKLDDVTKTAKLDKSHLKAVKFMKSLNTGKPITNYTSVTAYVRDANRAAKAAKTAKVVKAGIGLATVGSLAALGPAGAALSAVDTYQRSQKYKQTGNKLDGLQAWLAGASTGTSATGIGEVISMPLDVTNLLIDAARFKRKGPIQGSRARFN